MYIASALRQQTIWLLASTTAPTGLGALRAEWRKSSALHAGLGSHCSYVVQRHSTKASAGWRLFFVPHAPPLPFESFVPLHCCWKEPRIEAPTVRVLAWSHFGWLQCFVSAARKVKHRRVLAVRRRGLLQKWHQHSFLCHLEIVDLEGGGASA